MSIKEIGSARGDGFAAVFCETQSCNHFEQKIKGGYIGKGFLTPADVLALARTHDELHPEGLTLVCFAPTKRKKHATG